MEIIKSFRDLKTWQEGHKLVIEIYTTSKKFPREEIFGITNQMRRAVVSFTSNIAEGFNRNSIKEKINFYYIALDSLAELENQLEIAKDIGYINEVDYRRILDKISLTQKITWGLIKKTKSRIIPTVVFILASSFSLLTAGLASAGVISDAPRVSTVLYNALQFLLMIFGSVAIIGIVVSGILYLIAAGDERKLRQAKKSLIASIVGIIVALSGLIVIRLITDTLK